MTTKKVPFGSDFFICDFCNYKSSRKSQYDRHVLTSKHKNMVEYNQTLEKSSYISNKVYNYNCDCGKSYPFRSSLYNHKKKCSFIINSSINIIDTNKELIKSDDDSISESIIIKELKDIIVQQQNQINKQQEQISELIPKIGNNNNIQNNKFNIKVFLDEKCKDAINMTDFVNSIKVSLEQLDYTKQYGLVDGLSKTIMENMNRLTLYERPLHCTDVKRETLYIKDDDKWSKDDSRERMKRAIKGVTNANYRALKDWQGVHPEFRKDDRLTDYFTDTIVKLSKSLDGIDDKVLKTICRSSYLKLADIDV